MQTIRRGRCLRHNRVGSTRPPGRRRVGLGIRRRTRRTPVVRGRPARQAAHGPRAVGARRGARVPSMVVPVHSGHSRRGHRRGGGALRSVGPPIRPAQPTTRPVLAPRGGHGVRARRPPPMPKRDADDPQLGARCPQHLARRRWDLLRRCRRRLHRGAPPVRPDRHRLRAPVVVGGGIPWSRSAVAQPDVGTPPARRPARAPVLPRDGRDGRDEAAVGGVPTPPPSTPPAPGHAVRGPPVFKLVGRGSRCDHVSDYFNKVFCSFFCKRCKNHKCSCVLGD